MSDRTVAQVPLLVNSSPTVGLTISVPTMVKSPRFAALSALVTASFVWLIESSVSAPLCGTRLSTWCWLASP